MSLINIENFFENSKLAPKELKRILTILKDLEEAYNSK
jgi:hypothetical protein